MTRSERRTAYARRMMDLLGGKLPVRRDSDTMEHATQLEREYDADARARDLADWEATNR